jgi:ubiquinone/menaquinone biosynthesis C-methylase UbiE
MDYDKTDIARTYRQARDHGPEFLQLWMRTISEHVDAESVQTILDLGCGTGRFSQALAAHFNAAVIGIDPSTRMLAEAHKASNDARVLYACGAAEALPLPSHSVDLIFISMAFHHFTHPKAAAQECRRALRKHGRVFLRTASREQIAQYPYVPYFPAAVALLEQRLPTLEFQRQTFEDAGFRVRFSGLVRQAIASNYEEYASKLALRADSILLSLADRDFDSGLAALLAAKPEGPVIEPIDFLVLRAPTARR